MWVSPYLEDSVVAVGCNLSEYTVSGVGSGVLEGFEVSLLHRVGCHFLQVAVY